MGYITYGPTSQPLIDFMTQNHLSTNALVWTNFAGELIGSMLVILIGLGVLASIQLRFKKENVSKIILFGLVWMGAIFIGVLIAFGIGDAYLREFKYNPDNNSGTWEGAFFLNPALVIARMFMATNPKNIANGNYLPIGDGMVFMLAEFIGMALGALLMYAIYWKLFKNFQSTKDQRARQQIIKSCFYTFGIKQNVGLSFLAEMTAVFVFYSAILCIGYMVPGSSAFANFLICILIEMVAYGLGGTTGMALNPMRDLAPRLMYQILPVRNYNDKISPYADWKYSWVPVAAPIVGAMIALITMPGFLYNVA